MTHSQKIQYMLDDLDTRGVGQFTAAPPLYRLLWKIGWKIRPPLFQGFSMLALSMGSFLAFIVGVWGSFFYTESGYALVLLAARFGILLGLFMAAYYRWKAHRLRLPAWEMYPETEPGG